MQSVLQAIHEGLLPLALLALAAGPITARLTHKKERLQWFSFWAAAAGGGLYTLTAIAFEGRLNAWLLLFGYLIAVLVAVVSGQLAAAGGAALAVTFGAPARAIVALVRSRLDQRRRSQEERRERREQRRLSRLSGVQHSLRWRAEARRRREEALQSVQQAAIRAEAEAKRQALDSHRDHWRYDLRFAFESLKLDVQTLLSEPVFSSLLDHALAPSAVVEIDRRCERLNGLLEALQPPLHVGLGDLEQVALAFEERRQKLAEVTLPERTKDKLLRWINLQEAQRMHQIVTEETT